MKEGEKQGQLIFGAAVGYKLQQIERFLASLNRIGYKGWVYLLVHRELAAELALSRYASTVQCITVPQWIPFRFKLHRGRRRFLAPLWWPARVVLFMLVRGLSWGADLGFAGNALRFRLVQWLLAPTETRFLHALRLLHESEFRRVLLCDVRDVVFQENPFQNLPIQGLWVGIETYPESLRQQPWNERWIRLAYGDAMLERLGGNPISCSGVTYGDREAMLSYLNAMADEIYQLPFRATSAPLDQALHNKILWTGQLGKPGALRTGRSALATLSDPRDLKDTGMDERGRLINADGSVISIVHMYDRWPKTQGLH